MFVKRLHAQSLNAILAKVEIIYGFVYCAGMAGAVDIREGTHVFILKKPNTVLLLKWRHTTSGTTLKIVTPIG